MSMVAPKESFCATVKADLRRIGFGDSWPIFFLSLFIRPAFLAAFLFRVAAYFYPRGILGKTFGKIIWRLNVFVSSCDISPEAHIGPGLHIPHPVGIVIGEATIGRNVKILQNVALGMRRFDDTDHDPKNYPTVGDDVIICAGAVLAGPVHIGDHAVIGANAVVTHDVPPHTTAVGIPARVVTHS